MTVLVACEHSQKICKAFREQGCIAFSCDILECSGGHPEWHIKGDVLPLLNGNCFFTTQDGKKRFCFERWGLIIAHPPCTFLSKAATSCHSSKNGGFERSITFDSIANAMAEQWSVLDEI